MRLGKLALLAIAGTALLLLPRRSSGDRITPRLPKNTKANTKSDKLSGDTASTTAPNPPVSASDESVS